MEQTQTCTVCKVEKPLSDYGKHKECTNGIRKQCKSCEKEKLKQYYEKNKKQITERNKAYQ